MATVRQTEMGSNPIVTSRSPRHAINPPLHQISRACKRRPRNPGTVCLYKSLRHTCVMHASYICSHADLRQGHTNTIDFDASWIGLGVENQAPHSGRPFSGW